MLCPSFIVGHATRRINSRDRTWLEHTLTKAVLDTIKSVSTRKSPCKSVNKKWDNISVPVLLSCDGRGEMDNNHLEHGLASGQPVPHHGLKQRLTLLLQLVQLQVFNCYK
jgi:hypothetical protein